MAGAGGTEVGRISIRVVPNTDRFRDDLKRDLEAIDKDLKGEVHVKAKVDDKEADAKLKELARDRHATIHVEVEQSKLNKAMSSLKDLGKAFAKGPGHQMFGDDWGKQWWGNSSSAAKMAGHMGGEGMGSLTNLGSPASIMALAPLVPAALAIVAPALASLPGLLTAIAAPAGTVVLGMDGIKKAMDNADLSSQKMKKNGDPGKLKAAGTFKDLQDAVGKAFTDGLTPAFMNISKMIPYITPLFTTMADQISKVAVSLSEFVASPQTLNLVGSIFSDISGFIGDIGPGLQNFTGGLLVLAKLFTGNMGSMSNGFNEMGKWVQNFANMLDQTGVGKAAFGTLSMVMDDIGDFLKKAMILGMNMAADPKMQQSIDTFLKSITDLLTGPMMPALANLFFDLVPAVSALVNALNPLLTALNNAFPSQTNVAEQSRKIAPQIMGPLKDKDGKIDVSDAALAADVSGFFLSFVDNVREGAKEIGASLEDLWNGIGNALAHGVNKMVEVLNKVADFFGMKDLSLHLDDNLSTDNFDKQHKAFEAQQQQKQDALNAQTDAANKAAQQPAIAPPKAQVPEQGGAGGAAALGSQPMQMQIDQSQVVGQVQALAGPVSSAMTAVGLAGAAGFMGGLIPGCQQVFDAVPQMANAITGQMAASGNAAGTAWGQGLAAGIRASGAAAVAAATDIANQVSAATAKAHDSHSPSRVAKKHGQNWSQGLAQGIADGEKGVGKASQKTGKAAINAMLKEMANTPAAKFQDALKQNFAPSKFVAAGGKSFMDNVTGFEKDLGWSGSGAIPTIQNAIFDWGSQALGKTFDNILQPEKYMHPKKSTNGIDNLTGGDHTPGGGNTFNFHTSNADETMQKYTAVRNKEALRHSSR